MAEKDDRGRSKKSKKGFQPFGLFFFILLFLYGLANWGRIWGLSLSLVSIVFILAGLRIVQQQERYVIEQLGKFHTFLDSGPRWIFPFLMRTRAVVSVWEQDLDLFPEKPWIDFSEGGTAQLIEPKVWIKIEDAYKAIYSIANWRTAVKERIENLLRNCLSNQTVEKIIDQKLLHSWWSLVKKELQQGELPDPEEEILEEWGIQITRITISDFAWDENVKETRQEIFQAERKITQEEHLAKAALYESQKKARESGGMHGEIKKILRDEYGYSGSEAEKVAAEYVKYFKGAETGRLIDWRSSGDGDNISEIIAKAAVAFETGKELMLTRKKKQNQE